MGGETRPRIAHGIALASASRVEAERTRARSRLEEGRERARCRSGVCVSRSPTRTSARGRERGVGRVSPPAERAGLLGRGSRNPAHSTRNLARPRRGGVHARASPRATPRRPSPARSRDPVEAVRVPRGRGPRDPRVRAGVLGLKRAPERGLPIALGQRERQVVEPVRPLVGRVDGVRAVDRARRGRSAMEGCASSAFAVLVSNRRAPPRSRGSRGRGAVAASAAARGVMATESSSHARCGCSISSSTLTCPQTAAVVRDPDVATDVLSRSWSSPRELSDYSRAPQLKIRAAIKTPRRPPLAVRHGGWVGTIPTRNTLAWRPGVRGDRGSRSRR